MSLRDNAIVAYAETKVMKKSDRDVWVLMGEILESLLAECNLLTYPAYIWIAGMRGAMNPAPMLVGCASGVWKDLRLSHHR